MKSKYDKSHTCISVKANVEMVICRPRIQISVIEVTGEEDDKVVVAHECFLVQIQVTDNVNRSKKIVILESENRFKIYNDTRIKININSHNKII
jgi:hypothetical protein